MASLRAIALELGVSYSWAHRRLERLLGVRPGLLIRMNNSRSSVIHDGYVDSVISSILVLKRKELAYYILPPVPLWPWILVNVKQLSMLEHLLESMRAIGVRPAEVIVDVGVMDYLRGSRTDFDGGFWDALWGAVERVQSLSRSYGFRYVVVMPDYPATIRGNVERTMRLQELLLSHDSGVPWLPVAQRSADGDHLEHLRWLCETGIVARYGRVALGSLKLLGRNYSSIASMIEKARRALEKYGLTVRLHAFGIQLNVAAAAKDALSPGSWDNTGWTYPRGSGMWSAKDHEEKIVYFKIYLDRIVKLLG